MAESESETESEMLKLFGGMTFEDTSSSSSSVKLLKKKEDRLKLKKKKLKKKNVVRVSSGVRKKNAWLEEVRKARSMDKWNQGSGKEFEGRLYYGVGSSVSRTKFTAEIRHPDGRLLPLGTFNSPELAARAYDQAAFRLYGVYAPLNFPNNNNNNNNDNNDNN